MSIREFIIVGLLSTLPDFDFLPGFLLGDPNHFHRGISHSLGLSAILSIVIFLFEIKLRKAPPRLFLWFFVLYFSHIVADYFGADTRPPFGQPVFWPLSGAYLIFSYPLFYDIQRSPQLSKFLPTLLSSHNLMAILIEILLGSMAIFVLNMRELMKIGRKNAKA